MQGSLRSIVIVAVEMEDFFAFDTHDTIARSATVIDVARHGPAHPDRMHSVRPILYISSHLHLLHGGAKYQCRARLHRILVLFLPCWMVDKM